MNEGQIGLCSLCGGPVGVFCCGQCGAVPERGPWTILPMTPADGKLPRTNWARWHIEKETWAPTMEDIKDWPPEWTKG